MSADAWATNIRRLAASLPATEAGAMDCLLGESPSTGGGWRSPVADQEAGRTLPVVREPDPDDPQAIRRVGVIGGGTAGYLAALALQAQRPWLEVTLVESSRIPVIGVGEATTPPLTAFLHHYLGIDPVEFVREVEPTWKLGIRFDWGPYQDGFMAPFDWGDNSVGVLGSLAHQGDPNAFTVQSLFMLADRVPVFRLADGTHVSLMDSLPFAYHLENRRLVKYLTALATRRGIRHVDAEIDHVELSDEEWVKSLHTTDGRQLEFDLYFDCTGFRSLLLGKALGTGYVSYAGSLFTDTAVTGYIPQGEAIEPYTRAATMDAGWCWTIPVPGEDHIGYVHAGSYLSEDQAAKEICDRYPGVADLRTVRFRVGRHDKMWRGNVIALGNSYGFVEPLESSALLMLVFTIMSVMPLLPGSWKQPNGQAVLNELTASRWDGLRWFLALHYKFNTRRDTEFWREVRATTDISGCLPLLDVFSGGAPLHLRDPLTRRFVRAVAPTFYELDGVDCVLLGQGYPAELVRTDEPRKAWQGRKAAADILVAHGLTQRQALVAYSTEPHLVESLVYGPASWVTQYGPDGWLRASRA
jgi:tryptophan 7-halogenase